MDNSYADQSTADIRCEWGLQGIHAIAHTSDVVIIVDVLSFSTAVDIAVEKNIIVYPYRWKDSRAEEYAAAVGAVLATRRGESPYSLSPADLRRAPLPSAEGEQTLRLVLPSPNGAELSLATGTIPTLCGCLRNARAVAEYASTVGRKIALIPAGERWQDASLRPAAEDLIGAGAIIHHLSELPGRSRSPESDIAVAAFLAVRDNLYSTLATCASGRELLRRGYEEDIGIAAEYNCSSTVSLLFQGGYVKKEK